MKQKTTAVLFIMLIATASLSAVSQDYIDGYLAGYADGMNGVKAKYVQTENRKPESSIYRIKYFVDDFGDPTDEGYISQTTPAEGTFSNIATRIADMQWYFIIAPNQTAFVIYEYGWSPVSGFAAYPTDYGISVKVDDGTVYTFSAKNYSDRISLDSNDEVDFLDILFSNASVKIVINEESAYSGASYNLGTVDCSGLAELYSQLQELQCASLECI